MKTKNRQSIRLPNYNYTQPGAYFITLVTFERECLFGKIIDGRIILSPLGRIAAEQWLRLPARFPNWATDSFGIMPNHIHGVLIKRGVSLGQARGRHTPGVASSDITIISEGTLRPYLPHTISPFSDSLGAIVRAF